LRRRPAEDLPFVLVNHYGPTEYTVVATAGQVAPTGERAPDLGAPIANTRVYVLDRSLQPVPLGVAGELCLAGEGLARGYRSRPDLTAERFVPDPFGDGGRLYRTGDLARRLPSGDLGFLGRIDHQVKIRGHRIELGEIEAALGRLSAVREAVVVVQESEHRLVACVVPAPGEEVSGERLRAALAGSLPAVMIPAAWVFLDALPLTPNGKVDRKALAGLAPAPSSPADVAPRTPVEAELAAIWRDLLGVPAVGVADDLFALGGHSLLAVRIVARVRERLGVDMPLRLVFEAPTVAGLAAWIEAERLRGGPAATLAPAAGGQEIPLSFAQQRLWFLDRLEPGSAAYNIPILARIDGPLQPGLLAAALAEVVRRHEALRTTFELPEGAADPVQAVHPPSVPSSVRNLPVVDLKALPAPDGEAVRLAVEEARRPFDLRRGPLLRAALLCLDQERHRLLVNLHHVVADGGSVEVLQRELAALYPAFAAGRPSPLPEPAVQYPAFAVLERSRLVGEELDRQVAYWRACLAGAQASELPADRPRPAVWSYRGAVEEAELPGELAGGLERLGRRLQATPFMTLLAGFLTLLHRYTGQDDLLVGTPVSGRGQDAEGSIGFFINTLPLRVGLEGEPSFAALVARVRESALAAYAHQGLPFERLVAEAAPERDLSRNPLFQMIFAFLEGWGPLALAPGLAMAEAEGVHPGTAKLDLSFHVNRAAGRLRLWLEHSADLFDGATVRRLAGHFERLLEGAVERPEMPVAALPLLSGAERAQLAELDKAEHRGHPVGLLHGLFEAQARRTPGAVALVAGETVLTYAELEARSARLASRLRALGAGPEVGVAVCLERTADLVVTLLAVLRAGSFYVPVDPRYPEERRAFLVQDSGARIVVGPHPPAPSPALPPPSPGEGETCVQASNLAYLIYTSGSTGRPKAVAVTHASAVKLAFWAREVFSADELRGVLACTAVTFDLSVFEIFVTLAWGGAVVLVDDALALLSGPPGHEITLVNTVPSAMAELLRANALPASVRTVNLAGEALTRALSDRVYARPETARLYNLYGPSEDTTYSTWTRVERASERQPPIGRPVHDTRGYVVDRRLERLPVGIPGELCLAGDGLSRGYLGRPDMTAERFVPDPFSVHPGERMYRTGDLAKLRADGDLDYLGRLDHQVKIRGYRIEPGEVESVLMQLPRVRAAAVLVREDVLVGYLAAAEIPVAELRQALLRTLPEPMVPAAFVFLADLPLTPHGKVDRRALAGISPASGVGGTSQPPRTATESAVAGIWSELLGVEGIGAADDFFALGGHSLLATRLAALVRERLGVELPLRAVFQEPTVERLAARIEAGRPASGPVLAAGLAGEPAPLSFAQQRLWFLDRLEPGSAVYNIPILLRFDGPLQPGLLSAALTGVVRRHEALRTTFEVPVGAAEPVQVVHPPAVRALPVVDLAGLPEREAEAARLAADEARRPFDLRRGPLLRPVLLRLGPDGHRLLVNLHHIVADGGSVEVLQRELAVLYAAFAAGRPSPLPELPVQVPDFAVWQRRWLAGAELERQLAFWRGRLASPPAFELPADRPRPAVWSYRGAALEAELPETLAGALERLGRGHGATPFMALLAGFLTLLHRYTGQEDLLVGTPVSGREKAEVEGLIGFFVNTLPLRAGLEGEPTFAELLARVRDSALAAYAHQDVPFERLVAEVAPERDLSRNPLFQMIFAFLDGWEPVPVAPGLTMAGAEGVHTGTAKFDLSFHVSRTAGRLRLWLEYATDLFDGATVRRLAGHFERLLAGAVERPEMPVAELPLLSAVERAQLAAADEAEHRGHPVGLLHGLFEAQARRTPGAVALVAGETVLTYAELEARSARLAVRLRALGAGPEAGVAVCLERRADLVVTLLAVLRAGSFYVPIDPRYPEERRSFLVRDGGARIVVDEAGPHPPAPSPALPPPSPGEGETCVQPSNLAYLIYTSGSTGQPKAVGITHASAVKLAYWAREVFSADELRGVLACTAVTFDLSVFEIFVTLAWGGAVVLVDDALALLSGPPGHEITLVNTVPSAMAELLRADALPASVRTVNLAGESLTRALSDRVYGRPETARLYNLYGPSEDTTYSTWTRVERASERQPSIGRPVHDTRAYVVDRRLERLPAGIPGELCLAGDGLSRGYLGRPDMTAERFVPDPFSVRPGERMYRTGDLAKLRADGELDYLGRLDHQVKIRGFRIELGEVESVLVRLPEVRAAAVLLRENALVGYLAADEMPVAELRQALLRTLPEPMVPSAFVFLADLPLTPHGKVDRRALAGMSPAPAARGASEPLRTPMESAVAGIWSELLGVEGIGAADDFFALGGHSLLAARLAALVQERTGVELPLRAVFQEPTVARLAAWIETERLRAPAAGPAILSAFEGVAPLSFPQQRLWFFEQLQPGSAAYNIPLSLIVSGPLRPEVLAAALAEVVRRHAALRTTFEVPEGAAEPVQVVHPAAGSALPAVDLGALPQADREAEAARLAGDEGRRPFDLRRLPLLRSTLLRLDKSEHRLLVTMHHIVSDGWSIELLLRELGTLCDAFASGRPSPLPELPVQYPDFAVWQRSRSTGEELERQVAWWRDRLARPPIAELSADRSRPAVWSYRGGVETASLPAGLADRLEQLGRKQGATPFMTLFAAFLALLHRYTAQADLVVGTPVAGRVRPEIQELIGFFVNTLALRVQVDGDAPFEALLARVRETALEAYGHQEVPFEALVAELASGRDLSRNPLIQVVFALQNGLEPVRAGSGLTLAQGEWVHTGTAKFDLSLHAGREGGSLKLWAEYGADLFDPPTIQRLLGHFHRLLEGIADDAGARVSELPLLDAAEREQALTAWNRTEAEIPEEPVHRLFFQWAERTPEAVAVAWEGGSLTYGELAGRARDLADRLRADGVGPETVVALRLDRSAELLTAALAVLEAGGAYLPIDPSWPEERQRWIAEDSGAVVLSGMGGGALSREAGEGRGGGFPASLAYVIYTSGSTGRPKGTELCHRGLSSLIAWHRRAYGLGPGDRTTLLASPGFDASVWETWAPLTAGAAVYIPPREVVLSPPALLRWMAEREITVSFLPTPLAEAVLSEAPPAGLGLRALLTGGDRLRRRPAKNLPFVLVNHYGPTESTVVATAGPVAPAGERLPDIGAPIANTRVYILDRWLQPVPVGVPGELCLAGEGLARGYRHRRELTAETFVPDPFGDGGRLYRTGDLARRLASGEIEFLGRFDHQVKIRGNRIELGEVEAALSALPGVEACVAMARPDALGENRLVAYVAGSVETAVLRSLLEFRLPAVMIPSVFVVLPALPLDPNGKVDRRALPEPVASVQTASTPPRTPLEEEVARIWSEILGVERVGVEDSFWNLGGHSLLATRALARLADTFGVDVPLQALFLAPTLGGFSKTLGEAVLAGLSDAEMLSLQEEEAS
jgi:amino acid adenylation domain-containing protein